MQTIYKTSQSPSGETCHEVVISHEFGHLQVELPTEGEGLAAAHIMSRAKLVDASGDMPFLILQQFCLHEWINICTNKDTEELDLIKHANFLGFTAKTRNTEWRILRATILPA